MLLIACAGPKGFTPAAANVKVQLFDIMKRMYLFWLGVLSLCMVLRAGAQVNYHASSCTGPYVRIELGPAFVQDGKLIEFAGPVGADVDYQVGFAAGATIGYTFNRYFSVELEFEGVAADIKSVPGYYSYDTYLNNLPFLVNLTYSRPLHNTRIIPYVGAGLGGSMTIFGTDGFGNESVAVYGDDTDVVFAWQIFAGMRVELNPTMSLGVGYKYLATEDSSFSFPPMFPMLGPNFTVGFSGVRAHLVTVSFQVKF